MIAATPVTTGDLTVNAEDATNPGPPRTGDEGPASTETLVLEPIAVAERRRDTVTRIRLRARAGAPDGGAA